MHKPQEKRTCKKWFSFLISHFYFQEGHSAGRISSRSLHEVSYQHSIHCDSPPIPVLLLSAILKKMGTVDTRMYIICIFKVNKVELDSEVSIHIIHWDLVDRTCKPKNDIDASAVMPRQTHFKHSK